MPHSFIHLHNLHKTKKPKDGQSRLFPRFFFILLGFQSYALVLKLDSILNIKHKHGSSADSDLSRERIVSESASE